MNNISISIIIPVYNVEKYVKDCIGSILNQIQDIDEVIIIDDGSIDKSFDVCKQMTNGKKNVRLIQQSNKGPGATRNIGLSIAQNDYVLFVDSDDMLRENSLYEIKSFLKNNFIDILFFCAELLIQCDIDIKKNPYDRYSAVFYKVISGKEMFLSFYPRCYTVSPCLAIFRRMFLLEKGITFGEGIFHEDIAFSFETLMGAKRVFCVPDKYYIRRYRDNSIMTSAWSYENWFGTLIGNMQIWNYLIAETDGILQQSLLSDAVVKNISCELINICQTGNAEFRERSGWSYEQIISEFLKVWRIYYQTDRESITKWKMLLHICDLITNNVEYVSNDMQSLLLDYDKVKKKYLDYIKSILLKLPFYEKNLKIGIYGTGRHTKKLLQLYKYLLGNIESDYCFIETDVRDNNSEYLGKSLIGIEKVDNSVDLIIVSSLFYQEEMNEKINTILGLEFPRICFYKKDDVDTLF
jgi:glycosyltransferase involved in cell wall biosynthesis